MKATETTVLNFIGGFDKVFIIPPFQRNYEWSFEQCDELFQDIVYAHKSNKSHYLGNVVYYVGKNSGASYNEIILIDGQQRVTTVLLLLCALRDCVSDTATADSINRRYLMNDTNDNRFRVRLKQTSYDMKSFISIIDGKTIDDENNVTKNYNYLVKLISESEISPKDLYETIPKLEVVDVNLQIENDLEAVQTVFEKINSTGKRLTPADLIRNYLLLANSSQEQDRLYEDYWVKIEQLIKNENISRFARDYLIMNIFEDVPDDRIYKGFKEHFNNTGALHIDIMRDMYKYAKYYSWLKFENCPNNRVNKVIKLLNYLKTDDVYPLYLYLFDTLFEQNSTELLSILNLISDFMLRYRVVAPSGGGGALRSVVQQLLEGLNSGVVECNYDTIYFELSNSRSPTGRYPNDEEFIQTLMDSVNTNYARAVLLRIEEYERKNISVPLEQVTVEHLLPQTLSEKWIEYLGGNDKASEIYDKYLQCIGNLAPVSKGYNARMSNRIWSEKIKDLQYVQFVITSQVAASSQWKESEIQQRNEDVARRACKAITPPLARIRKYQSKNSTGEFATGTYLASDIVTPMTGAVPEYIVYNDNNIAISTWKEYLSKICQIACEIDAKMFEKIVQENKIHKATSTKNYPDKDPIISKDKNLLVSANKIGETGYFSEGTISSNRARVYASQVLDIYGIADNVQLFVRER